MTTQVRLPIPGLHETRFMERIAREVTGGSVKVTVQKLLEEPARLSAPTAYLVTEHLWQIYQDRSKSTDAIPAEKQRALERVRTSIVEKTIEEATLVSELVGQALQYSCAWFHEDLTHHHSLEELNRLTTRALIEKFQAWLEETSTGSTRLESLLNLCAQNLGKIIINSLEIPSNAEGFKYLQSLLGFKPLQAEKARQAAKNVHDYLETINASHYHDLREALACNRFKHSEDSQWPTAILDKGNSKGYAELRPATIDAQPFVPPEEEKFWVEQMWKQREELSDLDADVLDSLSSIWLRQVRQPEQDATASVNQLLEMRGLVPKMGGQGRRGGYRATQRTEMLRALGHIQNLWIHMAELEVYEEKTGRACKKGKQLAVKSRAFAITDLMGQLRLDGYLDVSHFIFRPGKVFANFLFGVGRQTALLSAYALRYDPYRQQMEKRLTRYLSWQWRCQAKLGCVPKTYRVSTLLEAAGEQLNTRFPQRSRDRLECALETLLADNVIAAWEYTDWAEEAVAQRGWVQQWKETRLTLKAPAEIVEKYLELSRPGTGLPLPLPSVALQESLRQRRQELNLTQVQVALEMGVDQSTLNRIEQGKRAGSPELRKKITDWLISKQRQQ